MLTSLYNGYKVNLVQTVDDIITVRNRINPKVNSGLDTETTGLTFFKDKVVGVCISCGPDYSKENYQGYYLPIRHYGYKDNLPIPVVMEVVQYLYDECKVCLFNRPFDNTMLEAEGVKIPCVGHTHDVQIMAHLTTNESFPALKEYVKNYLKMQVIDFESNNAKNHDFGTTDPLVSYVYAAQDPLVTVLLGRKLWAEYPYIRTIYPLDNRVGEAVRRLTVTTKIPLDKEIINRELSRVTQEQAEVQQKIFAMVGYPFKLNSPRDKADALSRFVTLTVKTKGGQFAVNDEVLSRIDHPLARLLQKYAELEKFRGSYLQKMSEYPDDGIYVNYSTVNVSTGRLSSGSSKGNDFFANFNIQNVPKVEVKRYLHRDDKLGYRLDDVEEGAILDKDGNPVKMKVKGGLRDAFKCPDGYIWLTGDYAAEEMRLMGNFSGEVNFIEPILNGYDIHNYIAKKMFGYEDPSHRTKVKVLNFAVGYGANEFTISRKLDIPVPEAKALLDNYNNTLVQFNRWKREQEKEGRRKGMVFTYFGRPRLLYKYYNSSDRSLHAFADRTAVNTVTQGCTPTAGYLETDHSVQVFSKVLGQRIQSANGVIVPTHRGSQEPIFCVFNTGDFMVCDINHQFITGSLVDPIKTSLRDGLRCKVLLSRPHKRKYSLCRQFWHPLNEQMSFICLMMRKDEIKDDNKQVAAALLRLALSRKWFKLSYQEIIRVRSLCSVFGYNVVYSEKRDAFRIKFHRAKKARLSYVKACLEEGNKVEVGSCTVLNGLDMYPNQGFWNKNTGGDIIRLVLCKLVQRLESDKEFADNVIFANTVHDEINLYVKPDYLHKAFYALRDMMYFCPSNFKVPIVAELGVGTTWGNVVDCHDVSEDNKIILPEYES